MNTTKAQFLRAVALRQPYQFGDTGLAPSADGGLTFSRDDLTNLSRSAGVLMLLAAGIGGGLTYLFTRK